MFLWLSVFDFLHRLCVVSLWTIFSYVKINATEYNTNFLQRPVSVCIQSSDPDSYLLIEFDAIMDTYVSNLYHRGLHHYIELLRLRNSVDVNLAIELLSFVKLPIRLIPSSCFPFPLHVSQKAAIKKMDMQATKEFLAELKVLTNVHHLNLVSGFLFFGLSRYVYCFAHVFRCVHLCFHLSWSFLLCPHHLFKCFDVVIIFGLIFCIAVYGLLFCKFAKAYLN